MRLLIDGKFYRVQNDVRVIFDTQKDQGFDTHVILRDEGMTIDLVDDQGKPENPIVGSAFQSVDDLIEAAQP